MPGEEFEGNNERVKRNKKRNWTMYDNFTNLLTSEGIPFTKIGNTHSVKINDSIKVDCVDYTVTFLKTKKVFERSNRVDCIWFIKWNLEDPKENME